MRSVLQFAKCAVVLVACATLALPALAQRPRGNYSHKPAQSGGFHRQEVGEQRRPPRQEPRRNAPKPPQGSERNSSPPRQQQGGAKPNVNPNRPPANGNPNRPPNANRPQGNQKSFRDMSPDEKKNILRERQQFRSLPPQRQQDLRDKYQTWRKLSPEQQNHIKNDVLPRWKQLPPQRQRAIQQRLGVLKSMPESARNRYLDNPEFTRGMNDEDRATLRDLSHLHVGGSPDPPSE
ncbi:MAG TPA: DUF3106 domain-containing protein [Candidatus Saccharimonadales bacterium]|nr:DUF3106 domain-containing protein [Candidatus Saccharimonadales bacterium]